MVAAGLVAVGRGPYDRFRGRLLWPIRETSGDTIGFGARRIFDDDKIEAKYLNTPETPIYKKSQVLYGVDLARRDMARSSQAVIVEGYTDVMACHLAGVTTAVATCGTAFGDEHAKVLRRLLADHEEFRGEVIFTFDGDEPGQKAALKVFQGDQKYVAQTYVAIAPDGMDPCDLRIKQGDAAVRELIATRQPLYRFVLANVVGRFDLDRADSRVDAMREAARLVSASCATSRRSTRSPGDLADARRGIDTNEVLAEVRRAAARGSPSRRAGRSPQTSEPTPTQPPRPSLPRPARPAVRHRARDPQAGPPAPDRDRPHDRPTSAPTTSPTRPTAAVWALVEAAGGPAAGDGDPGWVSKVRDAATEPEVSSAVSALAVEPIPATHEPDASYVAHHVFRLLELTTLRRIAEIKSRLQRTNPETSTRPTTTRCSASSRRSSSTAARCVTGSSAREVVAEAAVAGPR